MYTADQRMASLDRFYSDRVESIVTLVESDKRDGIKAAISAQIASKVDEIFELVPQANKGVSEAALLKTGLDNVSLRVKTFNSILDSVTQHLKPKIVSESLFRAGIQTGIEFSNELFDYFLEKRSIPGDYDTFVAFWMKYDSSAGFGVFSLVDQEMKDGGCLKLSVKDSFVIRGHTLDGHRYCRFVEGYVYGLLYESLHRLCRTLESGGYMPPGTKLYPISSTHTDNGSDTCVFEFVLKSEELEEAHTSLFWANEAYLLGVYRDTISRARSALEKAVKEKLGIPVTSFDSFYRLLSTLFNQESGISAQSLLVSVKSVREAYQTASKFIHEDSAKPQEEVTLQILDTVTMFLFSLDHEDFTKKQKDDTNFKLAKGPETHSELLNEIEHRKQLRLILKRNLEETEKREAKFGIDPPLRYIHEKDDFKGRIEEINRQIASLESKLKK